LLTISSPKKGKYQLSNGYTFLKCIAELCDGNLLTFVRKLLTQCTVPRR